MKRIIYILIIGLLAFGCKSTSKNIHKKYLEHLRSMDEEIDYEYLEELRKSSPNFSMDSIRVNTSDFYAIEIISKPNKEVFTLDEEKRISMKITNYGNKVLYLPEWFRRDKLYINNSAVEMTIEIYRKEKKEFVPYVQKRMSTYTHVQGAINTRKRAIYEIKNGKHIVYENIWVDFYKKIVDEGSYKVKIYIDLSNFGYFKPLESEVFFEVKE